MRTSVVRVVIASAIITSVVIMLPIMATAITTVMIGTTEIIVIMVYVRDINTEVPIVSTRIDRTIEIFCP